MELKFEWDERKNTINMKKHNVSFDEAKMVFFDPKRLEMYDKAHSFFEERWTIVGLSGATILRVSFTERNKFIRIMSARKAAKQEEERYFYGYSTSNSN